MKTEYAKKTGETDAQYRYRLRRKYRKDARIAHKAETMANESDRWNALSGGFGAWRNDRLAARLRHDLERWVAAMRHPEFGTLTLRTRHGGSCPCRQPHDAQHSRHCDGLNVRRTRDCRVPGVQRSETLVKAWLHLTDSALVVEEFGDTKGRRHFHYLASGSETHRAGFGSCFPCMAGLTATDHGGHSANDFWRRYGGRVDSTLIDTPMRAVEYVLKQTQYVVKDQINGDEFEQPVWRDGFYAPASDDGRRLWLKGWRE